MFIYDLKYYWKKWRSTLFWIALGLLLLFIFRFKILGTFGGFLISTDNPQKVDAVFVLGGNSEIRAKKASQIYSEGLASAFITTGEHYNDIAKYYDVPDSESAMTKGFMTNFGVPDSLIVKVNEGTSTYEESQIILDHCLKNGYQKVMVISDLFHTRRIRVIFENKFDDKNIELLIVGASSNKYEEGKYWEKERGFVMAIEEYIKLVHHLFK